MKVEIEDIDSCNKKLRIEIPFQNYQGELKTYYKKLSREVNLPGFRKGKIPQSMLEKKFGAEVKREVLTQMVSDSISQAIEDNGLKAVGEPSSLNIEAEEGTDITVTADVEVVPPIETKDVSGIKLDLRVARITESDVDKVIEVYQERNAEKVQVTDRALQEGDLAKIDFEGSLDGKPFESGQAKDYVIEVGSKHLIEGFDEAITGMMPGEVREFRLPMPEQHPNPELASKDVDFKVTLKGIQVKQLPAIDDAFAQKADPDKKYGSVEELRAGVRSGLEDFERTQAKKEIRKDLAEALGEGNPIDIPERLVKEQIRFMVQKEQQEARKNDPNASVNPPEDVAASPEDEARLREQAVKLLQQELVIGKWAEDLNVDVSENELNKEIQGFLSLLGGGDLNQIKQDWAKSGALQRLYARLRREKTLDQLMDKIILQEEMVDREALKPDN